MFYFDFRRAYRYYYNSRVVRNTKSFKFGIATSTTKLKIYIIIIKISYTY